MKKWIIVLLVFGAALVAHGDTLSLAIHWDQFIANGTAPSVTLHRNRTIAGVILPVSGRPLNEPQTDASIRGYNTTTGNLVWTDTFPAQAVFVEAAQDYALAVASVGTAPPGGGVIDWRVFIRSYDLHSGEIRWTSESALTVIQKTLLRNGKLVIVGSDPGLGPIGQPSENGVILVFDAATGVLLWKKTIDFAESAINLWDVDEAGRNIVVVGTKDTFGPFPLPRDLIVRSYRLRDGEPRWEFTEPGIVATAIRVVNDLAVVAGFANEPGAGIRPFLAAYGLGDGIRQWKAETASVPIASFGRLAVTEAAVIASGFNFVGAFNRGTGEVLWSRSGSLALPETANQLIPIGGNLVTAGTQQMNPPFGPQQLVIRILDAAGNVVAEDERETGDGNRYADAGFLRHDVHNCRSPLLSSCPR